MDFYAFVSIIDAILKLSIAVLISSVTWDKLLLYGLLLALVSVLNFFLYFIYCKNKFSYLKLQKDIDKSLFKELFSFSGWSVIDPFSYMFRDQGSNMILNLFFGPIINAAYGISAQISGAVTGFASNLSIAFRPQIIQAYSSMNYTRVKNLMFSMSRINFILQMCIAIPLVFEMQYILSLWLGNSYPEYTIIFASMVVIINGVNCLNEPVSIIMVATGRIKKVKTVSMCIICSVVPIGYLLFALGYPPFTIYIVMFCLTLINQCSCVIIMHQEFAYIKPLEYLRVIIIPLVYFVLLSLIVPFLLTYILMPSFTRLVIVFILSISVSLIWAYIVCLTVEERQLLLNILKRIRFK